MENKIKNIISNLFEVDIELINNDFSSDNTDNWDSLGHMNLVVALEEEFDIEFEDEEILELITYELILNIINEKIG